jgi:predicted ATPase/DNA-binding winged helix-turn-helix (wHTH) protein
VSGNNNEQDAPITFGPFRLSPKYRLLEKDGAPLHIGGRALDILIFLADRPGEVVDKRDLIKQVWAGVNVDEGSLRFHVTALRKALGGGAAGARYVVNVPGRGYCFAAPLTRAEEPPPAVSAAGVSAARSLPAPPAKMVGRIDSIEKITAELVQHRFVTIVGPGGIGKTSVAVSVGHRQFDDLGGQVFFVDFGALRDTKLAASSIASALGVAAGAENPLPSLLTALRGRQILLIFDSCEHILDALAPLAERLNRELPELRILATSRESFRAEGERVFRLFPLDCPPQRDGMRMEDILAFPAAQLFIERVTASLSDFRISEDEAPLIAEICRRLDGIPLAIELAAGRVNAYGIAGTASLLNTRFSLLWRGRRTAIPRHQTLGAALGWSYDLLSTAESAVLRRLSVFVGPFNLEAALAVACHGELNEAVAVEVIADLLSKSLITAASAERSPKYRLLDTTRAYAFNKLDEAAETGIFSRRHAEYFLDLFEQAEAECETLPISEWLTTYGPQIDNVRTALDWAFSANGDATLGVALTVALVPLLIRLSLFGECRERAERAIANLDPAGDERTRMQLLAALGWSLMYGEGRARGAGLALATTLELANRLDDKDHRLRALWGLCIDQFNNGEFGKALEFAHRFTKAAQQSPDPTDLMLADRLMAVSLHYLGDQKAARHHIDRVDASLHLLAEKPKIFPLDLRISTHYFRARILWLQGLATQSLALVTKNVEEGRANHHALTFCSVLGQSACPITYLAGDLDAAERYGTDLLEHADRHGIRLWRLWAAAFNALVVARKDDRYHGLALLRHELNEAGDARYLPRFLFLLGELAACLGEASEIGAGLALVDDALARCQTRQEQWYAPELLRIKGELVAKDERARPQPSADQYFRRAADLAKQQGARFWELRSSMSLARLRIGQNRKAEARQMLTTAMGLLEGDQIADVQQAKALLDTL